MVDGSQEEETATHDDGATRRKHLWEILGVAAAVAGVVIGLIQVWPKPAFTLQDWAKEANAVCAETSGDSEDAARAANDALSMTLSSLQQGTATPQQFFITGNLYYRMAGLQNKAAGNLSNIHPPSSRADETEAVVRDMRESDRMIYQGAELLRHVNTQYPQETVNAFSQLANTYNEKGRSINRRLVDLGARDCLPNVQAP
ncbi:hypothetical protein C3486_34435 [Streptomyces sp. Ru73]|nr:hypothetical protein C3486_34435 [Streptomyces sp. Ru73]